MKPITLFLRGFRGIRDGLGREEISLDLDAMSTGAQLIAIRGANGRGKTTILDNMTPFPTMPSRAGGDGSGAFSYYEQVYLPENVKDLVWEHGGRRYRSQIVIRTGGRRRTEAYLHVLDQERWVPVRTSDGTLSDGKMETYEACLGAVLGPDRTFFVSAFAPQGRRQLCSYRTGEVKALLADLLGLDEIRLKGQQAGEVAKLLRLGLAGVREELAVVMQELDRATADGARLPGIDHNMASQRGRRAELQDRVERANAEFAGIEAERWRGEQDAAERATLQSEQSRIEAAFTRQRSELYADLQREQRRRECLEAETSARLAERTRAQARIGTRRTQAEEVIADAWRIERSSRWLALTQVVVAKREERVAHYLEKVTELREFRGRERSLEKEIDSVERAAGKAVLRIEELRRRFGLTQTVPCKGLPMQENCRLLADANGARPMLPSAAAELGQLNETRASLCEQLSQTRARAAHLLCAPTRLSRAEAGLARSRHRATSATELAARRGALAQADALVRECEESLSRLERNAREEQERDAADRRAIDTAVAEVHIRMDRLEVEHREAADALSRRIAQLPPAFDCRRVAAAHEALTQAQAALRGNDEALHDLVRQHAIATQAASAAGQLQERRCCLESKCGVVEAEFATWTVFVKCMGSDGLIALMIDDAGPELARVANDLLVACYGPRFTLSIRTQVETAKGEAREGFEIVVHDADSGHAKCVTQMSGGERVWINDCLTRAIALYVSQSSGRKYETLFSDESDGPLDPERKRMFMNMKREVLRLGGYDREYFISQTTEVAALADVVIDVDEFAVANALPKPGPER
jgi:DNA repair protein SbcC/Rad50